MRGTVLNWPEKVKGIVDGYRTFTTISHAVQKDAIQNGWDARKYKRGKEWEFIFELIETKERKFLLMTDRGTIGLTGKILSPKEYEQDLLGKERWGRFEGVAFTQPRTERSIGSRGRGKFIFVGASKEHTILYDTLRNDGSYRFGFRTVEKTESPIAACDAEEGKKILKEITGNLIEPLPSVGTRVIIVNPVNELIKDLKSGKFLRYIGETWWEIILKYNAIIKVKIGDKEYTAKIPDEFNLNYKDSEKIKVWIKKNQNIHAGYRESRCKNLHIIYSSNGPIAEDIRGVTIQRNGMKICKIEPKYMGREISERIYGYISFDQNTEEYLLEDEGIEHYSYDYRQTLPGAIKRYVEDEILKFAREKLGYGKDIREIRRQKQRSAERRALTAVNNFSSALGMGAGPGVKRRRRDRDRDRQRVAKEVRIQMDELSLPRPSDLRVNYGESVKNIRIRVINETDQDIYMQVKLFLRFYDQVCKEYCESDVTVRALSTTRDFGPFEERFAEINYPDKGRYTFTAKIVSLRDEDKATKIDYKTKSFYLEDDPPMRGIFERCQAFTSSDDKKPFKYWMGYSESGSERGLILYYNLNHPGYMAVSEEGEDRAEYILRIAGQEICGYDLMQEEKKLFKDVEINDAKEVLKQERAVIGEIIYKFRRGEI